MKNSKRRWIEAARIIAEDPTAKVLCPENQDAELITFDIASEKGNIQIERYLICPSCRECNIMRLRRPIEQQNLLPKFDKSLDTEEIVEIMQKINCSDTNSEKND